MTRDLYLRDACILPGMRPWGGADDEDADAMATGRLDPDLRVRIYLFNIPFACAARRRGRAGPTRVESGLRRSERRL